MVLLWTETFATRRSVTLALEKYTAVSAATFTTGRLTGQALNSGTWTSQNVSNPTTTGFHGLGVQATTTGIQSYYTARDTTGVAQYSLRSKNGTTTNTIRFELVLGTNGTSLVESADQPIAGNFWRYIRWQIVLATTATGTAQIQVDSQPSTTNSGIITSQFGTQQSAFTFQAVQPLQDYYWIGSTGAAPTSHFARPIVGEGIYPSGTGNNNEWTPSTGTAPDGWQLIDDGSGTPIDTDFASTVTGVAGVTDTWAYTDLSFITGDIQAVEFASRGFLESTGSQLIRAVYRTSGGTQTGGTSQAINTTNPMGIQQTWTVHPTTAAAWAVADVNGAQFGRETTAS